MSALLRCAAAITFCITICLCRFANGSTAQVAYVSWDNDKFLIHNDVIQNWVAKGEFLNEVNSTGWSYLEVTTRPPNGVSPDGIQAYAAGLVEGYLTRDLITMHWQNTVQGYCEEPYTPYCQRLRDYLQVNLDWMNQQIDKMADKMADKDPYWHQVELFLMQVDGLKDGYFNVPGKPSTDIDPFGIYMFQVGGDFEDLEGALHRETSSHVFGSGSCSALIKVLPGNKDLFVSQDTWSTYQSMLRILKRYDFSYHTTTKADSAIIPGHAITFSSYPGTLMSGDDFYTISSGLATQETTIGNGNSSLWMYIKPTDSVPEGIRCMVANRLATTGEEWTTSFSTFNSGTYNNQWMIVDYKQFTPGSATLKSGLLTIVEQIPGIVMHRDMTDLLQKQTYWPSYNIPYFPFIFNMSGGQASVQKYGDWFSYEHSPRAEIFRRDNVKVTDLDSMMKLMRYNDFKHDPLSRCNCTPPYSAENGISARCDLNPVDGTYPFGALGHRSHGGTDMKLTNMAMVKNLEFITIGGPTYDQQSPFQWSKSDYDKKVPHVGHPDLFKFDFIHFNGTVNYKVYKAGF